MDKSNFANYFLSVGSHYAKYLTLCFLSTFEIVKENPKERNNLKVKSNATPRFVDKANSPVIAVRIKITK